MKKLLIILVIIFQSFHANSQCFLSISAGRTHVLGTKTDHSLWAWGDNLSGQAGLSTNEVKICAPRRVGSDNDWEYIFAGSSRSFAIKSNGSLWAWGDNRSGQFGNNTRTDSNAPIQIGIDTDWISVSTGGSTIAIKSNETVWGWGSNSHGELGLGHTSMELTPVQIGSMDSWEKILCGGSHTLAINKDGTLWACGANQYGQLGDGSFTDKYYFIQIGSDNDWVEINANSEQSIAIKKDGTIWAWGNNIDHQLSLVPSLVNVPTRIGSDNDWKEITPSIIYALKTNGTLWSLNSSGFQKLDDGNGWVSIFASGSACFMEKPDATFWGIGSNRYCELTLGTNIDDSETPILLPCSAVGIAEVVSFSDFQVYPNPTSKIVYITNRSNQTIKEIRIHDINGKLRFKEKTNFSEINIINYPDGIYFLKIISENKTYNTIIIKK
ncbi:T9SS type A sorting domain-containing protein [Candidatus Dojkabacteria bacterium]|nr:T9SS type A sorting domain-containing protein [Candidatus Dojkabacteria bacterium]